MSYFDHIPKPQTQAPHIWYPSPVCHEQHRQWTELASWLKENLPEPSASDWAQFFHYNKAYSRRTPVSDAEFFARLMQEDAAPLVRLLFPADPKRFLHSKEIRLSLELVDSILSTLQETTTESWQQEAVRASLHSSSEIAYLNATALSALCGATCCLEALLELGADPNGMDCPASWNTLNLTFTHNCQPVTPLDCAILAGRENCRLLLEMYGGQTSAEILGDSSHTIIPIHSAPQI